jgi:hypothetical protein
MSAIVKRGTSTDVPNAIVERDSSGNFAAGTITATLIGTASEAEAINGILITGTPTVGETLVATSGTTADWQAAPSAITFVDQITPFGVIDGSNVTFTLPSTPDAGSVYFWLNGVLQRSGIGNDYTISSTTITTTTAPEVAGVLLASYRITS